MLEREWEADSDITYGREKRLAGPEVLFMEKYKVSRGSCMEGRRGAVEMLFSS